jgi:hypothetical protein
MYVYEKNPAKRVTRMPASGTGWDFLLRTEVTAGRSPASHPAAKPQREGQMTFEANPLEAGGYRLTTTTAIRDI